MKHLLINKDVKASLVKGLNGDPELEYAFEYDEILPEVDLILPAYTSGSIFNFLDKSLSFLTIYRTSSVILELAESFSNALGVLLDNENKRAFLISYSSKRDGTTDCYFEKILDYKNFKKEINNSINKEVLEEVKLFAPDNLILNKEFKFNLSKIIKKLKPLTLQKRKEVMSFVDEDEYDEKKELQKKTGTYIYLLNTKQINNQISSSKMDGSIRFSFPKGKGGKPNFMGDAKLSYQSEIEIKAKHFV